MQKRWTILFLSLLVSGLALLGACSSSSHSNPPAADEDIIVPVDGDKIEAEAADHLNCDESCRSDKGYYCHQETQTCRIAKGVGCVKSAEKLFCKSVDANAACLNVKVGENPAVDLCLKPCTAEKDCQTDFEKCQADPISSKTYCYPQIPVASSVPSSLPGGPCEYGALWPGSSCMSGDSCVGNGAMLDAMSNMSCERNIDCAKDFAGTPTCDKDNCACKFSCTTNQDCKDYGIFGGPGSCQNGSCAYSCATNDDCAQYFGGAKIGYCDPGTHVCGFALCVTPCLPNNCCPDLGIGDLYPETISGQCYCGPGPFFRAPEGQTKAPFCLKTETVDGDQDGTTEAGCTIYPDDYCSKDSMCSGCTKCDVATHKCVPKAPECTDDLGCAANYTCDKTICGGTCRVKKCPTDLQCNSCQTCLSNGTCRDKVPDCTSNDDCSAPKICDKSLCGGTCAVPNPPECDNDHPCAGACKVCSPAGKCEDKPVECSEQNACTDTSKKCDPAVCGGTCVAKTCLDDPGLCNPCQTCNAGVCDAKPAECASDAQCTDPKVCDLNVCSGTCVVPPPPLKKFPAPKAK